MRRLGFSILAVAILGSLTPAQDSVTITSDPHDLSRPVSTLINQIRQRERISITYEDPRYRNSGDTEDVTAEVSRGSEVEKAYGPRILVPRGHSITFVYAPTEMRILEGSKLVIERMLQEYASLGGPAFAVVGDGDRLHVVPSEISDHSGVRRAEDSILNAMISIVPAARNGGELLEAICEEVQKQTGYEIGIGPSVPGNYLAAYKTSAGIGRKSARSAIAELLDRASVRGSFDWDLYYDPSDRAYMLNFSYVGPAGPVERTAK